MLVRIRLHIELLETFGRPASGNVEVTSEIVVDGSGHHEASAISEIGEREAS